MNGLSAYLARATEAYNIQLQTVKPDHGVSAYLTSHALPPDSPAGRTVIDRYRLGVVELPLTGDERFTGMLSIPYLSPRGVKALKFRATGETPPAGKYGQHAGQTIRLYNVAAYFAAGDTIGLCEGEIDAIVATERLGVPTMGIPGVQAWTKYKDVWAPVFKDFSTVLVFSDGDEPGHRLAANISETIGWRARVIKCPDGEDVASMVAKGEAESLKDKCELAIGVNA